MANKDERLIDRDPDEEEELPSEAFYKNETFLLVIKLSLALGVVSSLLTGLILTNSRLSTLEEQYVISLEQTTKLNEQMGIAIENLKTLTQDHERVKQRIQTLDLDAAKGELSQALDILDTQSQAMDKQLAVTRNGLMSLSRMVKGSRVWQEDYRNQYETLFNENKEIKAAIKKLRGIQEEQEFEDPRYLEMDFWSSSDTVRPMSIHYQAWGEPNFRPVNKFYKKQKHKGSASADEQVFVAYQGEDIVAAVRLVPYEGFFWLRSLYVEQALRGQGIGLALLEHVHTSIDLDIHCFPYDHLEHFYALAGYRISDTLPTALQQLYDRYSGRGEKILAMSRSTQMAE